MNRRGFLTAMAAAPVAAVMAPAATPFVSTFPYGASLSCGVPSVGIVDFGQSLYLGDQWYFIARASQAIYDGEISIDEANAAYWDQLDEVPA